MPYHICFKLLKYKVQCMSYNAQSTILIPIMWALNYLSLGKLLQ